MAVRMNLTAMSVYAFKAAGDSAKLAYRFGTKPRLFRAPSRIAFEPVGADSMLWVVNRLIFNFLFSVKVKFV